MVRNLRLGGKIGLVIAVQIVIMLALVWFNFWQMHALHQKMVQTFMVSIPKGGAALRMRALLLDAVRLEKDAVLSDNDQESQVFADQSVKVLDQIETHKKDLADLINESGTEAEAETFKKLDELWQKFRDGHKEMLALAVQNSNFKANRLLEGEILERMQAMRDALTGLRQRLDVEAGKTDMAKNSPRLLALLKRGQQLDSIIIAVQDLYRLLDAHNGAKPERKQKIEMKRETLTKEVDDLLREVEAGVDEGDRASFDRSTFDRARAALAEFRKASAQAEKLSTENTVPLSTQMTLRTSAPTVAKCDALLAKLGDLYKKQIAGERDATEATYQMAKYLMIGATIFGTLVSLALSLLLTRSITAPLQNAAGLAQAMARGDLTRRLQVKQQDEIGQLCQAVDSVTCTLARIVTDIRQVSGNIAGSANGLNKVSEQLLTMSQEISLQASTAASASEQMAMNINTMAAAAEEMSMNVATISSASEEMNVNISTISSAAEQTSQNVHTVAESIQEMTQTFGAVRTDVQNGSQIASQAMNLAGNATHTMNALDASASEIGRVTEVIKMIALQTNLLALNATIEATSAGEAGKGFAVVAGEIKELANQSGKAAEDIARKIETMQGSTREAVAVIQKVSKIISEINRASERIAESVEHQTHSASTIARNVSEASMGVGDVARSIAEVSKGANDVSRNAGDAASGATDMSRNAGEAAKAGKAIASSIQGLERATTTNAESAKRVNSSAQELTRIAAELQRLVGQFHLDGYGEKEASAGIQKW